MQAPREALGICIDESHSSKFGSFGVGALASTVSIHLMAGISFVTKLPDKQSNRFQAPNPRKLQLEYPLPVSPTEPSP